MNREYITEKIWELDFYTGLYKNAEDSQKICDCSPSYLAAYDRTIPYMKKLYDKESNKLKILIILRNPVDVSYSHYMHQVKRGKDDLSFEEAIRPDVIRERVKLHPQYDYVNQGMFYSQVKSYLENFPMVKVVFFEELKNARGLMKDVFTFLEVEDITGSMQLNVQSNPSGKPRNKFIFNMLNTL